MPPAIKGMPGLNHYLSEAIPLMENPLITEALTFNEQEGDTVTVALSEELIADPKALQFANVFRNVLAHGDDGFKGEISRFLPEPSASNNYLYNADDGAFMGTFACECDGYTDEYGFAISKSPLDETYVGEHFYKPANGKTTDVKQELTAQLDMLIAEMAEPAEAPEVTTPQAEAPAEAPEVITPEAPAEAEPAPLVVGLGDIARHMLSVMEPEAPAPAEAPAEEPADEVTELKQRLAEAEALLQSAEASGFIKYAEEQYASGTLLEADYPKQKLVTLLSDLALAGADAVALFGEGTPKLTDRVQELIASLPKQIALNESLSAQTQALHGAETKQYAIQGPASATYSEAGAEAYNAICAYCEANNLDYTKPAQFLKGRRAMYAAAA
jgi:hypothetical protein